MVIASRNVWLSQREGLISWLARRDWEERWITPDNSPIYITRSLVGNSRKNGVINVHWYQRDGIRHFTRARLRVTAVIAVFTRIVLQRIEHDDGLYNGNSRNFADRQSDPFSQEGITDSLHPKLTLKPQIKLSLQVKKKQFLIYWYKIFNLNN